MKTVIFFNLTFILLLFTACQEKNARFEVKNNKTITTNRIFEKVEYIKNIEDSCNCLEGQQNINSCYSESSIILEKIMLKKYNALITHYKNEIAKTDLNADVIENYQSDMKNLIASQKAWNQHSEKNNAFWLEGGGTLAPMYASKNWLKDLYERIQFLKEIEKEVFQNE